MGSENTMPFQNNSAAWQFFQPVPEYIIIGFALITFLAILITPVLIQKFRKLHSINDSDVTLINSVRGFFSLCLLFVTALHPGSPVNASAPGTCQPALDT
jgi:hypothetical protein